MSHMASTYSGAQPQSRWMSRLPSSNISQLPAAILQAARMIFCVTKRSARRGDSWLKRTPEQTSRP